MWAAASVSICTDDGSGDGWSRIGSTRWPGWRPSRWPGRAGWAPRRRWSRWPSGRHGAGPDRCRLSWGRRRPPGWSDDPSRTRRIRPTVATVQPGRPGGHHRHPGAGQCLWSTAYWKPTVGWRWCGWPLLSTPRWWFSSSSTGWGPRACWPWPPRTCGPGRWPPGSARRGWRWRCSPRCGRKPPPGTVRWSGRGWRPGPRSTGCVPRWCSTPTTRPTAKKGRPPGRR